ncbi:hypothetical protein DHEL01_v209148 [Diaporthe helianthi]|uniref:CPAF-like PDZ domain-containing protein n=1 Tax=Diaporthe helianthi TaxID=158607 RepID=A0A2P5HQF7_DIAHE|nr:hypothetical protein DHEL01_v209148 [Diaporthe helianthi]
MVPRLLLVSLGPVISLAASIQAHGGSSLHARQSSTEPCAAVGREWAAQKAANVSVPVVDGQLAYDCLNSVPLHAEDAVRLVRSIQPYLEWQSTTSYLKDPPADYQFPAFDIPAAFEDLVSNVKGGRYANEYAFLADLYATFSLAKDGHFRFTPDLIGAALQFRRQDIALASVSLDGVAVPQIYAVSDLRAYNNGTFASPSPVTEINGEDAVDFLEGLSLQGVLQDRDALYNTMFYSPAMYASNRGDWQGYFGASGRYGNIYPNASTSITFENGTTIEIPTVARVVGDFSNITDGESFYAKYCSGTVPVADVATPTPVPNPRPGGNLTGTPPLGYPTPVVMASDGSAAGYFLPDSDVAVLALLTYGSYIPAEFQLAVQTLIEDAKAAGKTKLIVDVSANGGGLIFQGHDTFRQLFPQIQEDGFNRFRSNELLQISGKQFSAAIPPGFNPETTDNDTLIYLYEYYPNFRFDLNLTNQPFVSAEDKFSPQTFKGDEFTPIHRWNFDDPLLTTNETFGFGFDVTGYRSRASNFTQPFAAEDIILLYDGYCASTCTLFSEFLRVQANVRSVTFGGRPGLDDSGNIPIIQNYGGVKGSNNVGYDYFSYLADVSLSIQGNAANTTSAPVGPLSAQETSLLELNLDTYAANRSMGTSVNVRDNILRDNLDDGLPAQFVYEPTDCRLFYTPKSIIDPEEQWRQVAEAAWGGGKCVAGSLGTGVDRLKRNVVRTGERKRTVETKVISLPDKKPVRGMWWEAEFETSVPY